MSANEILPFLSYLHAVCCLVKTSKSKGHKIYMKNVVPPNAPPMNHTTTHARDVVRPMRVQYLTHAYIEFTTTQNAKNKNRMFWKLNDCFFRRICFSVLMRLNRHYTSADEIPPFFLYLHTRGWWGVEGRV